MKGILIASLLICASLIATGIVVPQSFSAREIPVQDPRADASYRGGWQQQESGVSQDLNGISFVSLNQGSIAGDQGVILGTVDGGGTWTAQDSGVLDDLYDISYYGDETAVAVGNIGIILTTSDAGQTWVLRQTGMMETYYTAQMLTSTVGFIGGVDAIHEALFLWTNSGWNTWDWTGFFIQQGGILYHARLTDLFFFNESYGLATAYVNNPDGGAILRTTDAGQDWQVMYYSPVTLNGIDVASNGVAYAVGNQGAILWSLDEGQTWDALNSGVSNALYSISCPSGAVGVAVGSSGLILRSQDSGSTWTPQNSGVATDLLRVDFVDDMNGWVVGKSGVILHTQTGGYPTDTWPPVTSCSLNGTLQDDEYISNVTVTLTATDNLSGVAQTLYSLDNGPWVNYSGPFLVTSDGTHTLGFFSIDNAGNVEQEQTSEFSIQRLILSISITGGFGVHVTVQNTGTESLVNEPWNLSLAGGIVFFGRHSSGILSVTPGHEITLSSLVVGLGKTQIMFSAASDDSTAAASVFLFFVRII